MRTYVAVKGGVAAGNLGNLATSRLPQNVAQAFESPGNLGWQPGFLSCRKRNGARTPPA
jgi:hypothetical protein